MLCFEGQGIQGGESANDRTVLSDEMGAKALVNEQDLRTGKGGELMRGNQVLLKYKTVWYGEQKATVIKSVPLE